MVIDIRPAHIDDGDHLLIREIDSREIWRTCLSDPQAALRMSIATSRDAWTVFVDDEIMCIFGVSTISTLTGLGSPWLIGSDLIEEYKWDFLDGSKPFVEKLKFGYKKLENYVDDENRLSIAWLKWMGFKVDDPLPHGPLGKQFRKFTMEKK